MELFGIPEVLAGAVVCTLCVISPLWAPTVLLWIGRQVERVLDNELPGLDGLDE